MNKPLKVFSLFPPLQSPIMDFLLAVLPSRKGKGRDMQRKERAIWRVCQCTDSLQKIKSEICKTAPWVFLMPLIWLATLIRGWLHPSLEFCGRCNVRAWDMWLSWLGTCWLIYGNLQTHKTKRYLLFTYILNAPFTSYWINLRQVKVYFLFKMQFPFYRREPMHNIPLLWKSPHNIPPEQPEVNIPTLATASGN